MHLVLGEAATANLKANFNLNLAASGTITEMWLQV
jgi:hypothetical protein